MNAKYHTPDGIVPAGVLAENSTRHIAYVPSPQALDQARQDFQSFRELSADKLEKMGLTTEQASAFTLLDFIRRPHR